MKLPNGYGSVFKLSGNRRKKFGARVTVGWTDEGKQLYKNIGYFAKRTEAIEALTEYNKRPYDLDNRNITFKELYEKWSSERFEGIKTSTINGYKQAFKHSAPLHDLKFRDIRKEHLQDALDGSGLAATTQKQVKNFHSQLFKFAIEIDVAVKNYSDYTKVKTAPLPSKRSVFTQNEIDVLFANQQIKYADTVLILLFTGMRISELLEMKKENVNLEEKYMRGGVKTKAGINRLIPLNDKILPLIERYMQTDGDYLITNRKGEKMSYVNYLNRTWNIIMQELGMSHTPHDTRHTFISMIDETDANKTAIKRIVGHSTKDITEHYTHKDIKALLEAVNKI